MKKHLVICTGILVGFLVSAGCGGGGGGGGGGTGGSSTPPPADTSDRRSGLLQTVATLTSAKYADFAAKAAALANASTSFCAAPNAGALESVRAAWRQTMLSWAQAETVRFGPVRDDNRLLKIEFYPDSGGNVQRSVDQLIGSGQPLNADTLAQASAAAQGLSALDYVLFGSPSAGITSQARTCEFLTACTANFARIVQTIRDDWDSRFAGQFAGAGGGSVLYPNVSAAVAELVTSMVTAGENVKNRKVGDPLGKSSGGAVQPNAAESLFSGSSTANIQENLRSLRAYYYGGEPGADGFGIDDVIAGGQITPEVDGTIKTLFGSSLQASLAITTPINQAVGGSEKPKVEALYQETTQLVRALKNAMPPALGVSIGFNDTDGD